MLHHWVHHLPEKKVGIYTENVCSWSFILEHADIPRRSFSHHGHGNRSTLRNKTMTNTNASESENTVGEISSWGTRNDRGLSLTFTIQSKDALIWEERHKLLGKPSTSPQLEVMPVMEAVEVNCTAYLIISICSPTTKSWILFTFDKKKNVS